MDRGLGHIFFGDFMNIVTCHVVPDSNRMAFVDKLFGLSYVLKLEPTVFNMATMLAAEYDGAYWEFFALSNTGFYMAPRGDTIYAVCCENGFEGKLSGDALGITACLYTYSSLSFGGDGFADVCAQHFHWLREYAMQHAEVTAILRAID
jgi:hypothetical protein